MFHISCLEIEKYLRLVVPNIPLNHPQFSSTSILLFENIKTEIENKLIEKGELLLKTMREKYYFLEIYKRLMLSDIKLDKQIMKFKKSIKKMNHFNIQQYKNLFIKLFSKFINGYSDDVSIEIETICIMIENEYLTELGIQYSQINKILKDYFTSFFEKTYQIMSLVSVESNLNKATNEVKFNYSCYLFQEEYSLDKVLKLGRKTILAVISISSGICLFIIISEGIACQLNIKYSEPSPIVASGSSLENFIICNNVNKVISKGFINNSKEYCETQKFDFKNNIISINSAAYLQGSNDLFFIDDLNILDYFTFSETFRNLHVFRKEKFEKVEGNGDFLFLYSENRITVVNSALHIVFKEDRYNTHCFFNGQKLILGYFDGYSLLYLCENLISDDYFNFSNKSSVFYFQKTTDFNLDYRDGFSNIDNVLINEESLLVSKPIFSSIHSDKSANYEISSEGLLVGGILVGVLAGIALNSK